MSLSEKYLERCGQDIRRIAIFLDRGETIISRTNKAVFKRILTGNRRIKLLQK